MYNQDFLLENFDDSLTSTFFQKPKLSSTIEGSMMAKNSGLRARTLLTPDQLAKVQEIRNRHLKKAHQRKAFQKD